MKKYLVFILTISVLLLSACSTDANNESNIDGATTKIEASNKEITSEKQNTADTTSKTEEVKQDAQPQKTVITVNAQTAKMSFLGYNSDMPQKNKNYTIDKVSAFEEYTKKDMQSKEFNVLGVEYKNVPYHQSEKNKYTAANIDQYKNDAVKININSDGIIDNFYPSKAINVFPNETKHSEELAKKYLDMIMPNYKYDKIRIDEIEIIDTYIYSFSKMLNGVCTSDGVGIALNSKGSLVWYTIDDVGKYDNIEIENFNIDEFLQRVDAYVKDFYGDKVKDYNVQEYGPHFSIFADEKLELTIPIELNIKKGNGNEYSMAENVVFELN